MASRSNNIVPINRVGDTEKYILVPRREKNRVVKKVKRLIKVKGGCYFTQGVPYRLIDFIYRAVVKLGLRERKLIFSRGSVKVRGKPTSNVVDVYELDWDLGISFIIPLRRRYDSVQNFVLEGRVYPVRLLEIMVLSALLRLIHGDKSEQWRSAKAAAIITRGWVELEQPDPPPVSRAVE